MVRWLDRKVVKMDNVTLGRRCPFRRVIPGEKVSRQVLVCNSELQTIDCPIKRFPSGRCPIICSGEPGRMMGIKVAKHHLVSTVHQKGVKVGGRRTPGGIYTLTEISVIPPSSASTARTSVVLKLHQVVTPSFALLGRKKRGTADEGLEREAQDWQHQ